MNAKKCLIDLPVLLEPNDGLEKRCFNVCDKLGENHLNVALLTTSYRTKLNRMIQDLFIEIVILTVQLVKVRFIFLRDMIIDLQYTEVWVL